MHAYARNQGPTEVERGEHGRGAGRTLERWIVLHSIYLDLCRGPRRFRIDCAAEQPVLSDAVLVLTGKYLLAIVRERGCGALEHGVQRGERSALVEMVEATIGAPRRSNLVLRQLVGPAPTVDRLG